MIGLFVLFLAIVWLIVSIALAIYVTRKLPPRWWRVPVGVLLAVVLYPLPVIDSIVGRMQFERLCRENSAIHVDAKAAGRTVYLAEARKTLVKGTWVPVVLTEWRFVDANTGETVVTYSTLVAGGGFFRLGDGSAGSCAPKDQPASAESFRTLGITYIEPPAKRKN